MNIESVIFFLMLLLCIVFSISLYRLTKKRKNISWDVKQGVRCYSCKKDIIEENSFDYFERLDKLKDIYDRYIEYPKSEYFQLCVSCNRNDKLQAITSGKFFNHNKINKLKKFLYSEKADKIHLIMIVLMIVFQVIDILIRNFLNTPAIAGSLYNILYWSIWYYKVNLTFGEKKENL